jgi:hypothetical protein
MVEQWWGERMGRECRGDEEERGERRDGRVERGVQHYS